LRQTILKQFSNNSQTIPPLNRRRGEGFKAPIHTSLYEREGSMDGAG